MKLRKGFTLIELLVVIAIIAMLMSILMPALTRVNDQAKNAVCKSNLHQFAISWKIFLDDNRNKFPSDMEDWVWRLLDYYKDEGLLLDAYAKKTRLPITQTNNNVRGNAQFAWGEINEDEESEFYGRKLMASFGINQYCSSNRGGGRTDEELFRNATVPLASKVPLMGDCAQKGVTPLEKDVPPRWENDIYTSTPSDIDEIRSFCINRHNYAINMLFLDWSVKQVRLKELWILRWKQDWNLPPEPLPTAWDEPDHWMRDLPDPF